jgi:hypothetical protein
LAGLAAGALWIAPLDNLPDGAQGWFFALGFFFSLTVIFTMSLLLPELTIQLGRLALAGVILSLTWPLSLFAFGCFTLLQDKVLGHIADSLSDFQGRMLATLPMLFGMTVASALVSLTLTVINRKSDPKVFLYLILSGTIVIELTMATSGGPAYHFPANLINMVVIGSCLYGLLFGYGIMRVVSSI